MQVGEKNTKTAKKYSLVNKLRREICKSNKTDWIYNTPKALLKLYSQYVLEGKLITSGQKLKDFNFSIWDVLSLLRTFDIKIHPSNNGKKLQNSPIFSWYLDSEFNNTEVDTPFIPLIKQNQLSFLERYERVSKGNPYITNNKIIVDYSSCGTYEFLLRFTLDHVLFHSPHTLFQSINKYEWLHLLDAEGAFMFLVHLNVRGLAQPSSLRSMVKWRDLYSKLTLHERQMLVNSYYTGDERDKNAGAVFHSMHSEKIEYFSLIKHEMRLIRSRPVSHYEQFDSTRIYYEAWKMGIYDQMAPVERYRDELGKPISYLLFGEPTGLNDVMKTLTKPMTDAATDNIKDSVREIFEDPQTSQLIKDRVTEMMEPTVDNLKEAAVDVSEKSLSSFEKIIKPISEQITNFFSIFDSLKGFLKNVLDQIKAFFPANIFGCIPTLSCSPEVIVQTIKYYILYKNLDNTFLKTIMVALMLKTVGLMDFVMQYGKQILEWMMPTMTEKQFVPEGEVLKAEPTSSSWFESLVNLLFVKAKPIAVCTFFASLIGMVFKSTHFNSKSSFHQRDFTSMGGYITHAMRMFRDLGSGMRGIEQIVQYTSVVMSAVTRWVQEKIFGVKVESKKNELLVAKWLVLVKYFSTDAGRNVIRVSKSGKERASRLYSEGLSFLSMYAKNKDYISKETYQLIHRNWKDLVAINNYVARLNATSKFQPAMFHLQFVGEPGIGKSTLTEHIIKDISSKIYPEDKVVTHWTYNPNVEHFDGYNNQTFMIIDDLFRYNEPVHLSLLIGLITNTPVPLPMAHLEDKGAYLDSDILISSTNTPYPLGKDIFCMEAVHRRRDILVEVKMDSRVKKDGKFNMQLFQKYYSGKNSKDFPHLNFSLLKPVRYNAGDIYQKTDSDEMRVRHDLIKRLKQVNDCLKFDEDFYFGENARPSPGMTVPCVGWSYDVFLENIAIEYKLKRAGEQKLTQKSKFDHIESCFDDIDMFFSPDAHLDLPDGEVHKILRDQYLDMSYEYGRDDPLGQQIYTNTFPDFNDDLDIDSILNEFEETTEATPTSGAEESMRRERILKKRGKAMRDPALQHQLRVQYINGKPFIPITSHCTEWDYFTDSNTHAGSRYEFIDQAQSKFKETVGQICDLLDFEEVKDKSMKIVESLTDMVDSPKFVFPKSSNQNAFNSLIPIGFLKRLKYHSNSWYLNIDDIHMDSSKYIVCERNGNDYIVNFDTAFIFSMSHTYKYIANLFSLLTTEQQTEAVNNCNWQFQFIRSLSKEAIKEDLRHLWRKMRTSWMSYLFKPIIYIHKVLKAYYPIIFVILVVVAKIILLKSFSKLFASDIIEEAQKNGQYTSVYLRRNPEHQSGLHFKGRPTSAFIPKYTDQAMAENYLERNVKFMHIILPSGGSHSFHCIHTGQSIIFNAHVARYITGPTELVYKPSSNAEHHWSIEILPSDVYCHPTADVALLTSRYLPAAKKIDHHFIKEDDILNLRTVGELWSLTRHEEHKMVEIRDSTRPLKNLTVESEDGYRRVMAHSIITKGSTICGKSGSLLMSPNGAPSNRNILGIQAWRIDDAYSPSIIYQIITQELLEYMRMNSNQKYPEIIQTGPIVCEPTASKNIELFKSHVDVIGSVPNDKIVGMVGKTQFRKTVISRFMEQDGFMSERVPAAVRQFDRRLLVEKHPLEHSLNKYGRGSVGPFHRDILQKATQDLAYWYSQQLDQTKFRTDLTLTECIEGLRIPGSNSMDCRASPGLPYIWDIRHTGIKGKKNFFSIGEDGKAIIHDPTYPQQFEKTFKSLQRGIIPPHSSYDFPKDELRPFYKALGNPIDQSPPKTRSVTCMSMDLILSWRRVTLDLFGSFHRRATGDFPFAPGMNCEGPHWTNLYHYLSRFKHCLDFDVSNWDGHMPPELLYAAGDILVYILNVKYDSPTAKVIYALLTEVLFGHIQFEDAVYQKFRGLISGFPGTAEMNTIVHNLLMYYFYLLLAKESENHNYANIEYFFQHVSPVMYGDDVIMSVHQDILPWFNGKTIAVAYETHGYPVTTADKSGEIPISKFLHECQFLKSSFNFINITRVDRKLDISVAYDLIFWIRCNQQVDDQFYSNLFDAFRILHGHGKAEYQAFQQQVNGWLRQAHQPPFVLQWEDFEENHIRSYYK